VGKLFQDASLHDHFLPSHKHLVFARNTGDIQAHAGSNYQTKKMVISNLTQWGPGLNLLKLPEKWCKMLAHLQAGKGLNDRAECTEPQACAQFLAEAFQSLGPAPKTSCCRCTQ